MRRRISSGLAVWLFAFASAACTRSGDAESPAVPLYDDLGDLHHEITTELTLAQEYFDQGLRLTYAFNHAEAIESYREAARLDPACAMCYWGIAWASGPNINAAMDSASGVEAHEAMQAALSRAGGVTPKERDLIHAMAERYVPVPPADRARLDSAYARAMGPVAERYPQDPEVQVLHAEALMLLSPWNYWTSKKGPRPRTELLLTRLTRVVERLPDHPGACHFYIHAVEAAYPERAVPCAERLPALMPGAGHVVHMPGHIYIRVGRYADAVEANVHAVHADEKHLADMAPDGVYASGYHPHNYHFLSFAAEMAGRREQALDAARSLAGKVDLAQMREPGFGALQHYLMAPGRTMARFGMWDEILAEPAPEADALFARGWWHWTRGLTFTRRGEPAEAQTELAQLEAIVADPQIAQVTVWGINSARDLLEIGVRSLEGEIAAARGDHARAIALLREAARLEDALTYDEPPPWEPPIRHFLGAVLLKAGRPAQAETAYREDLERFPNNGWSLIGLADALKAQGKVSEAAEVKARFQEAWKTADVQIASSRF